MNKYRENLLAMGLTAEDLKVGTDEENWFGLLTTKDGVPVIHYGEGGSMYLSKKKALEIFKENPEEYILDMV